MPKVKVIREGVTLQGAEVEVGREIELSEKSAAALIAEGFAEGDVEGAEVEPPQNKPPEDETEKARRALADQYNLEDGGSKPGIKEAAQAAGVDFPFDAKKSDIIEAVIAQGKADELLK